MIKAGWNRHLVVKRPEKAKYEAALREIGWARGVRPPWEKSPRDIPWRAVLIGCLAIVGIHLLGWAKRPKLDALSKSEGKNSVKVSWRARG